MNKMQIQPRAKNTEPYKAALARKTIRRIIHPTAINVKKVASRYFNMSSFIIFN